MKRIISLLLAVVLLLSVVPPINVSAADIVDSGTCGDNLTWTLDGAGTLTISGTGKMYDYSYNESPFNYCARIESVAIANGVTSIGSYAFCNCDSLTSIDIPDGVTSIGNCAFADTSLTSIDIPDGVTSIGYGVFIDCSLLTSIDIPNSVTSIGSSTFCYCYSLTSVTIGNGVTSIGDGAFTDCLNLTSIDIPDSIISIGFGAFQHCSSLNYNLYDNGEYLGNKNNPYVYLADVVSHDISSFRINENTKIIGDEAFSNCTSLTSIDIPDSVTSIGNGAFSGTSLTSINIPDGVTSIGYRAFSDCYSLKSITIPDSVTSIGDDAFYWCYDLENVYYSGTQAQWDAIAIGENNEYLTNATIHYNHIHDYTLIAPVVVPATCTQAGYIEYTCAYGETKREDLKPLGHTTGTNAVITAPTCTEQGYTTSNCAACGERLVTDYVLALGHDYTGEVITKEPTCTEQGCTGPKCTRCDSVRQDTITDSLGHKIVAGGNVAPTCTEKGHTGGTVCQNCNTWFIQPTWSDALGHSFTNYINNNNGLMIATCDRCDATDSYEVEAVVIGEKTYATVESALRTAQEGETIKLLLDVQAEDIILTNGVTIDLNGCTLTVDALTAFAEGLADGYIVDSSEGNTGLLIVEKEKATFKSSNPDIPLYDAVNGGYRFFDYKMTVHNKPTNVGEGKEKFWFKFHFYTDDTCTELDSDAYSIVAAGNSGMEVGVQLNWKGKNLTPVQFVKNGSADIFVQTWADKASAARWLFITVSGLEKVGNGTLRVMPVITANGVVADGGNIAYINGELPSPEFGWSQDGPLSLNQ